MNTSKRKQKAIRLGIAAVLALVLLVAVSVVLVIANTTPTVQADAMKVTLDGKVNLIFKFNDGKVNAGTVSYTAVIGEGGREIKGLESKKVDGKNVVTVPLMPYEMAETVSLYQVAEDGTKLAVSTGSVRGYADKVLANSTYAEHHNAIRALLNYGAMTQIDKNANTSNLANADVFVRNNPIDIIKAVPFDKLVDTTGDLTGEISLVFSNNNGISDIALRYDINYETGHGEELRAVINGASEGVRLKEVTTGVYRFEITNIGVKNFATVWNVVITAPDGKTSTSQHSVLQYLNYLVTSTDNKITAEEKDVARSLYQLYQNTAGSLLADCKHLNPGYYIPADANSSYHMCAACGKMINAEAIDNKVTAYFSGKHLSGITPHAGPVTTEYSAENGYRITWNTESSVLELIWLREARYGVNGETGKGSLTPTDGKWGDVPFDIGNAKYLVIRYKVNAGSGITGIIAHLGSTEWTYEGTGTLENEVFVPNNDPNGNPYPANQGAVYSTKNVYRNGRTDCTAILSLDEFGYKVAADANGNRVIDGLKLEIAGTAAVGDSLTIESIEFVTHRGECVNVNGDNRCDDCGKELPTSAYIFNGTYLMKNNKSANGVHSLDKDGTFVAKRNNGTAWMALTSNTKDLAVATMGSPFNVGKSEYIVIKYKVPDYSQASGGQSEAFRLILSTENGPESTNPKSGTSGQYQGVSSIYIDPYVNVNGVGVNAENKDGWTYMVIHAPTVMLNYEQNPVYVANENGDYVIDCFYIEPRQPSTDYDSHFEIGYIAFAETLNDVETLFADDAANDALIENVIMAKESRVTLSYGVNPTKNDKVVEKVVNGKIQHGNMKTTMTEGVASTVCTVCNRPVLPGNTVIDGNLLVALTGNGANTAFQGTATAVTEGDNRYYRVTTTTPPNGGQHIWFREPYKNDAITADITLGGASGVLNASHNVPGFTTVTGDKMTLANGAVVSYPNYSALNVGTAKYLVMRARTGASSIRLCMSTVGYHNPTGNGGSQCTQIWFKPTADEKTNNEWVTYVLDLSIIGDKAPTVKDENGKDIRIFDTFYLEFDGKFTTDIDYIAFVNDWADVAAVSGETTVNKLTDIGGTRVVVDASTGCYKYLTANNLVGPSSTGGATVACTAAVAEGNLKFNISSKDGIQYLWLRENYYATQTNFDNGILGGQIKGMGADTTIDAGSARYIVIKVKSDAVTKPILRLSTTAYSYDKQTDTKQFGQTAISTDIPFQITEAGKWSVFVIDLDTYGEKVAALDGKRVFDTFILTGVAGLSETDSFEIQYIAFADTMDEVEAFAGADTVVTVTK